MVKKATKSPKKSPTKPPTGLMAGVVNPTRHCKPGGKPGEVNPQAGCIIDITGKHKKR